MEVVRMIAFYKVRSVFYLRPIDVRMVETPAAESFDTEMSEDPLLPNKMKQCKNDKTLFSGKDRTIKILKIKTRKYF